MTRPLCVFLLVATVVAATATTEGTCGMPGVTSTVRLLASAITPGRNGLTAYRKLCPSLVATRPAGSGVQWRLVGNAVGASASSTETLCRKIHGKIRGSASVAVARFFTTFSLSFSPFLLPGRDLEDPVKAVTSDHLIKV